MTDRGDIENDAHEDLSPTDAPSVKVLRLRYAGICSGCGVDLPKGAEAAWTRATRSVMCLACFEKEPLDVTHQVDDVVPVEVDSPAPRPLDVGEAGGSARREYERRHHRREEKIEAKWGRLAPVVKYLVDDPQSTTAWATGSDGERRLAHRLQRVLGERAVLLNDRKVPRTRGNIDHLAIAASGVWVIDAKNYKGKVERRDVGGWFKTDIRLYVNRRDRTRLATRLDGQVRAVKSALGDGEVAVHAALCFTDAEWRLFAKPFQQGEVWVTWANKLAEMIAEPGQLSPADVTDLATRLATTLPPAVPTS